MAKYIKKYGFILLGAIAFFAFYKPVIAFLLFSATFFGMGLIAIIMIDKVQTRGVRCTGKILSYNTDSDGDRTPVVEFKTLDGQLITAEPFISSSTSFSKFGSYDEIGSEIPVRYLPNDPTQFILPGDQNSNYIVFAIFGLIGLAGIIATTGHLLGYFNLGF